MLRDSWIDQYRKVRSTDRRVERYARQSLHCRKRMLHGFAGMSDLEMFAWSGGLALLLASLGGSQETDSRERSASRRFWAAAVFGWRVLLRARSTADMLQRARREAGREVPPPAADPAANERRSHAA